MVALLVTILALSLTVTKVVDFFRNLLDKGDTYKKWIWNVVALVVGLAFALGWQVNIAGSMAQLVPALADKASLMDGVSGQVLTGFIIGMSAGFWHELLDALSSYAGRNQVGLGG